MRYILLTGLSGAGKSTCLRFFEDRDCPYVDNLPPTMAARFIEVWGEQNCAEWVVFSADVRSKGLFDAFALEKMIAAIRENGTDLRVLFLEADDQTLLNRFKETRREHPLTTQAGSLSAAIAMERERMQPLRETADFIIDTTGITPAQLREKLAETLFSEEEAAPHIQTEIMSFGFKRGLPRQADLVFDVRFLPNPFYIEGLGRHTGLDEDVREFVMQHPVTEEFMRKVTDMLDFLLPHYQEEGKHRLVIAIGCTGGAHRSVAIAEAIGAYLREKKYQVEVNHRDLDMEQARWKNGAELAE